jgi:WD40-like Beta Propeller Repeat/HYR domain
MRRLALILAALFLALPASSQAAFPGTNGKLAFSQNFDEIGLIEPDGSSRDVAIADAYDPAWSPDGQRIAFTSTRGTPPGAPILDQEIYVANADGSGVTRVTNNPAGDSVQPTWSRDGKKIAYSDFADIYIADADGTGTPLNLTHGLDNIPDSRPAWSPDGSRIAFQSQRGALDDIIVAPANGIDQWTVVTNTPAESEVQPTWSPDGTQIAYAGFPDGGSPDIYVTNADGTGTPTQLTSGPDDDLTPAWSPDGSQIAFVRDSPSDIFVIDASGTGAPVNVTGTPGINEEEPDWQALNATVTVKHVLKPSSAPLRVDLAVDSQVVSTAAGNGDTGKAIVDPGAHEITVSASGQTTLAQYVTSISCSINGGSDVSAPVGTFAQIDLAALDTAVCTVTDTLGASTPEGSNVEVSPIDTTAGDSQLKITFTDVFGDGATALTSSSTGPAPPAGFEVVGGAYYHLETSASFSVARVCIPYAGPPPTIVHWLGGEPTAETTQVFGTTVCIDVTSFSPFALVRPVAGADTEAPHIACGSADGAWHAGNASIACTADDAGSGLVDPADATFSLSTSVADGTEDADAATGSRQVCDKAGNCATAGPIAGNKIDRKAPRLSLPADKSIEATSPAGVAVTYSATASDGADPHPVVHCTPASGSVFGIGKSTVTCTASDHVGNASHGLFKVTVLGAKEQIDRLISEVIAASKLPPAVKTQLLAQMRSALARFDPSKPAQRQAMCDALSTFAAAVRLLSGHGITAAQATQWIADANRIRTVIGCGTR